MYRRRRSWKISARALFAGVLGLAFLAIWLPSAWTRPLNNVMQLLAPAEDALHRAGKSASGLFDSESHVSVPAEQLSEYQQGTQALANRVVSLSARVEELEQLNAELTGLHQGGFPREGRLIPARVIRRDAVAWRDAVLLDRGLTSSAKPNDMVISRSFVNVGAEAGVADGMAVLAGELLVGRVVAAAPYTSTVTLLSDPSVRMPVRIGRVGQDRLEKLPGEFLLAGTGHGRMVIEDVDHKYIESQDVRVDDLVVSIPGDASLPMSLAIGRVIEIEPNSKSPLLLYRLHVEPAVDYDELLGVYVVDVTPEQGS